MPLVTATCDALWHCLCPSFTATSFTRPLLHLRPARKAFRSCVKARQRCNYALDSSRKAGHPQDADFAYFPTTSKRRFLAVPSNSLELPGRGLLDDLDTEAIYEELHRAGHKGYYRRVHTLVKILIRARGEEPNRRLYLALLSANTSSQLGSSAEVSRLLQEMADVGMVPDSTIYHAALKVLSVHPDYLLRKDVLGQMRERWYSVSDEGWHYVVVGMIRERQMELAMDGLKQMQTAGMRIHSWLYDIIIYTLCDLDEFDEALRIMKYRVHKGEQQISATLWSYILDTSSRALHHPATFYTWRKRVETGYLNPPSGICINVLNVASRHGDFRLATDVFRVLGNRTHTPALHHYEALLESYLAASDLKTALTILTLMTSAGLPPTESSTRPIYTHLNSSPSLPTRALSILRSLRASDRPISAPAVNAIIESHIHHQDLASAIETYKTLHTLVQSGPNTATFNALFRGCTHAGRKDLAMFLASEMLALNIPPNPLTYDRLILVCLDAQGDEEGVEDAWRYFLEMKGIGWWPRDGTVVALARKSCGRGDGRVWGLVAGEGAERGMERGKMERLVEEWWGGDGGKEEIRMEKERRGLGE